MTPKREPLLSDQLMKDARCFNDDCLWIRGHYEAARAKDGELIQRLVDAIEPADCHHPYCRWVTNRTLDCDCHMAALAIAASAGFIPTEP
jgi:hypothetical protein